MLKNKLKKLQSENSGAGFIPSTTASPSLGDDERKSRAKIGRVRES